MKKILSSVLAVTIILSSFCSISVFAAEKNDSLSETGIFYNLDELTKCQYYAFGIDGKLSFDEAERIYFTSRPQPQELDEDTENEIRQDYIKQSGSDLSESDIGIYYYGTLSDSSMLIFPEGGIYPTAIDYIVIGKYLYITSCIGNDVKIYKDNTFKSIATSYAVGELSDELLDEIAEKLNFLMFADGTPDNMVMMGDADGDGKVNVKDATTVLKSVASVIKLTDAQSCAADVNADNKVDVNDATVIQKFCAGIDTYLPIGEMCAL
ncbi:MAG: dockerin type I repeat-containing protein [Acutalibacteraceae bacterium]